MASNVSSLQQDISRMLFRVMLNKTLICFSDDSDEEKSDHKFVIKRPNIHTALKVIFNPTYWIPESYCRGDWHLEKGDLADLLSEAADNAPSQYEPYLQFMRRRPQIAHWIKQKIFTKYFSRKVVDHYNIDPDLYACFLDKEMVYTCAFFEENDFLEEAQQKKFDTIYHRLNLHNNSPRVLNIGCGWGSFERFLVRRSTNASVCGLSLSDEQVRWTNSWNRGALKENENIRIQLKVEDYINHVPEKQYDAITAIGMVEHVGLSGYADFFKKCYQMLKKDGTLLIHMIVKPTSNWPTNNWIDKYIFPGGYSPSVSELVKGSEKENYLLKNIHIHSPRHYAKTLQSWRENLNNSKEKVLNIYIEKYGYTKPQAEYLFRRWEVYFAGSEFAFRTPRFPLQIAQFIFTKKDF